jgi:hypothetical protein
MSQEQFVRRPGIAGAATPRRHIKIKFSSITGNDHAGVEYQSGHGSTSRSADGKF